MVVFHFSPKLLPSAAYSGSSNSRTAAASTPTPCSKSRIKAVLISAIPRHCSIHIHSCRNTFTSKQSRFIGIRMRMRKHLHNRFVKRWTSPFVLAANCPDRTTMRDEGENNDCSHSQSLLDDSMKQTSLLNKPSSTKLLTLPTILTLARVAAIPVLLCVFYSTEWWANTTVACVFVLAAITDWLDGFLARRMGSNSTFGAFLDPVADKLMVATTLVLLCTKPLNVSWASSLPWLIPLPSAAIIGREITMSAVREWAASQGEDLKAAVAVNNLGKWKTACQLVALTTLLATRNASETGLVGILVGAGVALLYVSAALAVWSLVVYMKGIWGALVK